MQLLSVLTAAIGERPKCGGQRPDHRDQRTGPGYLTPEPTWLYRKHDGQTMRQTWYPALEPAGMRVVCQRLEALRDAGLHLR